MLLTQTFVTKSEKDKNIVFSCTFPLTSMITGRKRYTATEPADPLHLALYKALTSPSWTSYARIAKASGKPVNRKLLQNTLHQYLDNSDVGRALPLRGFEGAFVTLFSRHKKSSDTFYFTKKR